VVAWESSGSGTPLVLVHGLSEDRRAWDPLVPRLEGRFRVVRLDLRGHGDSPDADDYGALAMAGDVAAVVAEAGIDEPPLLVGHSLGAVVVTAYATSAPARSVVNVDQPLRLGDFATALAPVADALRGPAFAETFAAVLDGLGHDGVPPESLEYLEARHRAARQDVVLGVWEQVFTTPPEELTALAASILAAVQVPYLAVHGSEPPPGYADWLTAQQPGARLEVWRGGHYPHLAEPDRFVELLSSL